MIKRILCGSPDAVNGRLVYLAACTGGNVCLYSNADHEETIKGGEQDHAAFETKAYIPLGITEHLCGSWNFAVDDVDSRSVLLGA